MSQILTVSFAGLQDVKTWSVEILLVTGSHLNSTTQANHENELQEIEEWIDDDSIDEGLEAEEEDTGPTGNQRQIWEEITQPSFGLWCLIWNHKGIQIICQAPSTKTSSF